MKSIIRRTVTPVFEEDLVDWEGRKVQMQRHQDAGDTWIVMILWLKTFQGCEMIRDSQVSCLVDQHRAPHLYFWEMAAIYELG